ncbi:transcriptional repressor LexA [Larsenimonas suaedae]|uniref:LexA repressor n=1 Tax=Larsenimonas suaedae TaxID=1851019 RepID=A0ABU1GUT3_9GAMM|nr:transcriptional repressor LexA [Larsenimonas suaedae]MCM2971081.1 transcriptional repressor LexA [Larsenimonas suaedae]MDR5895790.1 transcriptional repressor LexA [Larsenimonas suaedae]
MTRPLTARQQEVYDFIRRTLQDHGYPPTRAEIAAALGFRSANAAEEHLKALKKKGAIDMIPGTSRGIRLPQLDEPAPEGLPVVGEVAAGSPILAEAHIDRYCPLPADYFTPTADYLLRVRGLSMKNVGILDGDLLAVHRTSDVRDGQIVVARIDDEVTVKRLQRTNGMIHLRAENDAFAPIEIDPTTHEFSIEGIGVGIIRGGDNAGLH